MSLSCLLDFPGLMSLSCLLDFLGLMSLSCLLELLWLIFCLDSLLIEGTDILSLLFSFFTGFGIILGVFLKGFLNLIPLDSCLIGLELFFVSLNSCLIGLGFCIISLDSCLIVLGLTDLCSCIIELLDLIFSSISPLLWMSSDFDDLSTLAMKSSSSSSKSSMNKSSSSPLSSSSSSKPSMNNSSSFSPWFSSSISLSNSSSMENSISCLDEFLFNSSSNPAKYLLIKASFCFSSGDFSTMTSSSSSESSLSNCSFILWILAKSLSTILISVGSTSNSFSSNESLSSPLSSSSSSSFPIMTVVTGLIFIDSTSLIFFFNSFTLVLIMVDSIFSNSLALAKSLFLYQSVDQIW